MNSPDICNKRCDWFPCIITHNSTKAYKNCPCHQCPIAVTCRYPCKAFNNVVKNIFGMERINSNYRDVETHGDANVYNPKHFLQIAMTHPYLKEEDR